MNIDYVIVKFTISMAVNSMFIFKEFLTLGMSSYKHKINFID